ncbi:NADH dehydrogenase subunit 4 (mitochondrion) [Sitophilus oryzae]|uniref:NADH-ubiquinone oxidoreductase chain 4 n=1 Tax=Sitophilus oryzae TaxID=7048 RepID=A0A1B1UUM2_SITOR|nr:NADH dehydrogenase subunit 4 [Sitophilus oryzae]ANW06528.1 NADH dehydrogenase subunit 4 [Sitophilus oryzae]AQD17671.1 NADH dehydrogenase subunit 4 [Sitophilus oryzae]
MMKFLFMMVFLTPLCFFSYWYLSLFLFYLSFLFIFMFNISKDYSFLSYNFGLDLLSYSMVMLSFWICSLMLLASAKIFKKKDYYELFMFNILFLMFSLFMVFSSLNFFIFYLFFEISLIPTFFLIIGWGYQPERISAGKYLLFYTLLASLPMMVGIFFIFKSVNSLDFYFLSLNLDNFLFYLCINMVFFVKMPMYLIHLWLPKAHVEAPISGSMILAGVMLKLGGYGLFRVMKMFLNMGLKINFIFITISLIGSVYMSLICLQQSDIKLLIAYSSVSHMGLVLSGLLTLNLMGMWGSLVLMLGHGLCSSGLFCLANISYERLNSRSLYLNKGLMNFMPTLSMWWFLFCISNMAAPPSLNLLGEVLLINSLIIYSKLTMIMLALFSFFSACYSLFLYSYTQHGLFSSGIYSFTYISNREFLLLVLHWIPLNFLIFKGEIFSVWI